MGVIDDWGTVKFAKWLTVVKVPFRWWGQAFIDPVISTRETEEF